jgi:hypothetical protein
MIGEVSGEMIALKLKGADYVEWITTEDARPCFGRGQI